MANLTNDIMKDLKPRFDKALKSTAEEVSFEIEKTYEDCIQSFYEDYEPMYYRRTLSTYLASSNYNDIFKIDEIGNSAFRAGITVDAHNIHGDPYRADKEWVFNRTFEKGIHGRNRNDRIKAKDKYHKPGIERSKKNGRGVYTIQMKLNSGHFGSTYIYSPMQRWQWNAASANSVKNMTPPPQILMNRGFKKIANQKHLNDLFTKFMDS